MYNKSGVLALVGAFLGQQAHADLASMEKQLAGLLANSTAMSRSLAGTTVMTVDGYGCWCYFEDSHGQGRGKPVSEIDAACKVLHDGYECAMIDAGDDECVPWEVSYSSVTGLGGDALTTGCYALNGIDTCASHACIIEGNFVTGMFDLLLSGFAIDDNLKHANGFNVDVECPTKSGMKSDKACCGNYPKRFSYKTYGGDRACCQQRTYDTQVLTCCNDGRPKISC